VGATGQVVKTDPQYHQNKWYSQYYNQLQPQEIQNLHQWFAAVDVDRSGEINAAELANAKFPGDVRLDVTTCQTLIKTFDNTGRGVVTFYEYAALFKFMLHLQQAFLYCDRDRSGTLDPSELQIALHQAGFPVEESTVRPFLKRFQGSPAPGALPGAHGAPPGQTPPYGAPPGAHGAPPIGHPITFAVFVALSVSLAHARAVFTKLDTDNDGRITLDLTSYLRLTMQNLA